MARERLTRAERAERTRQDLLDAAERRFLRDGYHATTLDHIAEDAGYTKGAVYSAYESKAGLFFALMDSITDRRMGEVGALLGEHSGEDLRDELARRPVEEHCAQFLLLAEFWVHAARDPALLAEFAARYRRVRERLAELAPTCPPLGGPAWAIVTLALSHGLALERLIDPEGVPDDLMAEVQYRIGRPEPS